MQTFLPVASIRKSVEILDSKRLGKQRVEADQILRALTIENYGWKHHPAVRMWKGYEAALISYRNECIREWIRRGFRNTMPLLEEREIVMPPWFGQNRFHESHRSNLLRKDPVFYGRYGWIEPDDLPYVWPRVE